MSSITRILDVDNDALSSTAFTDIRPSNPFYGVAEIEASIIAGSVLAVQFLAALSVSWNLVIPLPTFAVKDSDHSIASIQLPLIFLFDHSDNCLVHIFGSEWIQYLPIHFNYVFYVKISPSLSVLKTLLSNQTVLSLMTLLVSVRVENDVVASFINAHLNLFTGMSSQSLLTNQVHFPHFATPVVACHDSLPYTQECILSLIQVP